MAGSVTTRTDITQRIAKGYGFLQPYTTTSTSATSGAAASGFFSETIQFNTVGLTFPGTLLGLQLPAGLSGSARPILTLCSVGGLPFYYGIIYLIGTVVLSSTGNQFTHDAATFPVLRTQFGAASQAVSLLPLIQITVATTVTAPAYIMRNSAPSAGYVNQDGASITGTKTFTMPAAATAVQSTYTMRLEDGDSAVQDVTQIDIQTAGSAGTASIYGLEVISSISSVSSPLSGYHDHLYGGLSFGDIGFALATAGTVTAYRVLMRPATSSGAVNGWIIGMLDT